MPHFCRHNHLLQNCPICSREQDVELRPLVSSGMPRTGETSSRSPGEPARSARTPSPRARRGPGLTVRRVREAADDGFRSPLVPGLKSGSQAQSLAWELAFAQTRLRTLREHPPGLYAEVAKAAGEVEERAWLAFLIAYLGPLEAGEDPFAAIRSARVPWASGQEPGLEAIATGPRAAHDPQRGLSTIEAYRAWAARAGSQAAAFSGEPGWMPERRFERTYERLALPGLHRAARFELLVSLGALGVFELRAGTLQLGGDDLVTVAAKRALGIGEKLLLERRAADLARACGLELAALDLALFNWERGARARVGLGADAGPDAETLERAEKALGL